MRKSYLIAAIAIVLVGLVALAWMFVPLFTGAKPAAATKITDPAKAGKMAVGFVAPPYQDDYQMLRLSGYVDNVSAQTLASVNVEIKLTDESGSQKQVVKQTLVDIPAHQRKTYDISAGTFAGPRNATIKIVSVEVAR